MAGVCISEEDVSGRVLAGNRWSSDGSTEELIGGLLGGAELRGKTLERVILEEDCLSEAIRHLSEQAPWVGGGW